jgi:hypothetical protein
MTIVRFSESDTASGYEFKSSPAVVTISNAVDGDVDGNGTIGALSDGLILIRYFATFRGQTLISNAVSANCTRCSAADIEAYIAQGVAQGIYDVDGNGSNGALSDGLILIRYFATFRGQTLISNAVSANCTRCNAADIEAFIADRLLPKP